MEQVFADYLTTLNIPVSRRYFRKRVASHPDYPSLLSISDTFEQLGIPHGVARMDRSGLENVAFPYILHLEKGAGEYILINGIDDLYEKAEIQEDWSGVVVKAEQVNEVKDAENQHYLSTEKAGRWGMSLLIASFLIVIALLLTYSFAWPMLILLATAVTGTILGYLLVAKDLGVTFDAVESFCNDGKSVNCDRVLRSDQAKLFGLYSLSDAVLAYFTVQAIVTGLLVPITTMAPSLLWTLSVASALSIPVVGYSLYLQGIKFKTWCRLCLLVAGLLVVQAGLFGWMVASGFFDLADGNMWATGLVAGIFLAAGSLVFLLKTRLKEGSEAEQAEVTANRIKYNPFVFSHLLLQQPSADCTPFEKELIIGNPKAPIQITMAASLGCGPCKDGFEKAKRLIKLHPEMVNLSVRFSIPQQSNGNETDPGRYILGYWLHRIYGTKNLTLVAI